MLVVEAITYWHIKFCKIKKKNVLGFCNGGILPNFIIDDLVKNTAVIMEFQQEIQLL